MNKYQEALDNQTYITHELEQKNEVKFVGDLIKSMEVNSTTDLLETTLQELVDKATPKKVGDKWLNDLNNYNGKCPSCNEIQSELDNKHYCGDCGQALLWKD